MSSVFMTVDSSLVQHNGKTVQIVKELPEFIRGWGKAYVPLYRVRVETGEEFDAFPDEIVKGDHK